MPKPASFLDMLSDNPHGWGNLPPMPQDDPYAVTRYQPDEYGTLKDSHGRFPESVDSTPSLSDSLYNIAVSPAQMLVGGVTEPLEALSRLGHSGTQSPLGVPEYNDANKHDMSTLTMAMFGGQAFNPLRAGEGMAARAGLKDHAMAAYKELRYPDEPSVLPQDLAAAHANVAGLEQKVRSQQQYVDANNHLLDQTSEGARSQTNPFNDGGFGDNNPVTPYDAAALNAQIRQRKIDTGDLFSDTGKPSAVGAALAGAETVSPRPGPGALIPEAKATGSLIAETDQYRAFIQSVQDRVDNGESGPFYGPRIPHAAADEAIMQNGLNAFRKDIKERQHDYWPEQSFLRHDNPDEWAAVNDHIQKLSNATALQNAGNVPIPAITSALDRAAAAAGQKLYIADDGAFGKSAYGSLETPAGNSYKVRVADHARQSGQHNSADFNVAPGSMTPEEFIRLLPTIYSDTGKPSILGSALAGAEGKSLPQEVWGPKFQKLMSHEYNIAVAGEDISTQYDILSGKYHNATHIEPEQKAAIKNELIRLQGELGPEWMRSNNASPILSDTGKPSLIGSALAGAEQGQPVRAYHGTNREIKGKLIARGAGFFNDGAQFPATWFTNKPRIASKFAENGSYESPNILPVDINSGNLKEVNYNYLPPNFDHIDETLSAAKAEGFDGVTFKNMADAPGYYNPFNSSNVTAMIKSGHVRSATTGETLFSDTGKPSLIGSALAGAERKNITLDGGRDYLAPQQTPNRYLELAKNHLAHIAGMPSAYGRLREYDGLSMGEAVRNIAGEVPSAIDRIKGQFRDNTAQYRDNIAQRQSRMAERFEYAIKDGDGNQIGTAIGDVDGDTMHLDWLGGKSGDKDILGLSGIRQLREQVRKDFPNVKNFTGYRVSGAKNTNHVSDRRQTVKILSDTGKPSILGSASAGEQGQDQNAALMDILKQYGVKLD